MTFPRLTRSTPFAFFSLPPPSFPLSMDLSPALLSCFIMVQDAYDPVHETKARPVGIIFDELAHDHHSPIDAHAVSPDFEYRPISPPVSECSSELSHSTDDSIASRTIGFGRKRHSILPTVRPSDDLSQTKIVGFGWKQRHHRHSVSGDPPSFIVSNRKQENRRSLPNPIIPRDGPFLTDPKRKLEHRLSLSLGSMRLPVLEETSGVWPARAHGVPGASRQPPKPLLLLQQVQARADSSPGPVKLSLASVVSSRTIKFIISHFAAVRRLRLKRLNLGHPNGSETDIRERKSLLRHLRKFYRRLRGL
ncbi:hypothetical protein MVEN_01922600 [Mycena venus]|uniref:Uncharacterized protein n=1 Tax=Mycena venus TaxID=2733690 RepID=A0A8H7CL14_9AGAR|nr:hypothetical protein MVEN_01922600 [Mycena venus]